MKQPINVNLMPAPLLFSQVIYVARSEQYRQEKTLTNNLFSSSDMALLGELGSWDEILALFEAKLWLL